MPSLSRHDVGSQCRDVGCSTFGNVATLPQTSRRCPCLLPRSLSFFYPTLTHPCTHPCHNPLLRPPTTSPPLPPPVFPYSRQSSVPVSHIHHHIAVPSPLPLSAPCEFGFCVARPRLVLLVRPGSSLRVL